MADTLISFYKSIFFKRIILYGLIALLVYELRSFTNLFLMLFFVTYVMNELCKFIHHQISKIVKVSEGFVIMATYSLLILLLVMVGIKYTPEVITQAKGLSKTFDISNNLNDSINTSLNNLLNSIHPSLKDVLGFSNFDFAKKIHDFSSDIALFSYSFIKSIGIWIFNILLLIILSLFFLIEKTEMRKFTEILKEGKISFVYSELHPLFVGFYKAFGSIIKARLIISVINTVLTIIPLVFLGFPNLFALSLMVFILGLIPVAGALFSSIPLILIGFNIGGLSYVFYILALIFIIHAIESYILFPKVLSNFTHMPIFVTLVVLLLSEHLLGPWGLIYGLPLFIFIVESIKQPEIFSANSTLNQQRKNTKPNKPLKNL